jgi:hypothetical protein
LKPIIHLDLTARSESYTYVPYIGIFYNAGYPLNILVKENIKKSRQVVIPVGLIFPLWLFYRYKTEKTELLFGTTLSIINLFTTL